MPLQATSGAASYDGFGGGAAAVPNYIEEVFSTYLYTGNGSTQTITNGIDLSTKGGLVWGKDRVNGNSHVLTDTVRGVANTLYTNSAVAQNSFESNALSSFNSDGFSLNNSTRINASGIANVSWTFRKQPKFFDIVTYTGNNVARTVAHNLGSVPGCIITKCISVSGDNWATYHRSTGASEYINLNTTGASQATSTGWNNTAPTSTVFSLGTSSLANGSGETYVAYLFAHDAGGFGLTGTDNVISCSSFVGTGGVQDVNLGYEPQWLLFKNASSGTSNWTMVDNMRGFGAGDNITQNLRPNLSDAESNGNYPRVTSTGFQHAIASGNTCIYITIRRGPMKVPTLGTSVYQAVNRAGTGAVATISSLGFPTDFTLIKTRTASLGYDWNLYDRLRGAKQRLATNSTSTESTETNGLQNYALMNGYGIGASNEINSTSDNFVDYNFRRAPGFFDEVCYTGNSVQGRTITHNLGVKPELMFVKSRSNGISWQVYSATETATKYMLLNSSQSSNTASFDWNDTEPTSSVFTIQGTGGTGLEVNWTGYTYVAYLFATCAGVSKVFSYTGNGSSQTINCGFTGGARFVLIKRTDSTGDWYVWDSARGIVAGNDPHLSLNTTAAEVTTDDSVDTDNTGFIVNQVAATNVNVSSATYIGLAIA